MILARFQPTTRETPIHSTWRMKKINEKRIIFVVDSQEEFSLFISLSLRLRWLVHKFVAIMVILLIIFSPRMSGKGKKVRERIFNLIKFMLNCLHSLVAHPNFECKLNSTSWKNPRGGGVCSHLCCSLI